MLGVCIPDSCNPDLITKILQKAVAKILNGTFSEVTISDCSTANKLQYSALDIFSIFFFSLIGIMMVFSTCYDCFTKYLEKKPNQLFLAFSVITNGKKLCMVNSKRSKDSIECLTGIRVLSMIWVLYIHSYLYYTIMNIVNIVDALSWYKRAWTMTVLMGSVSVDSFFLMSGLLVAWLGFRELDKKNGKINLILMWTHRYIRLTPALAAMILFYLTLNKYLGNGPFREKSIEIHKSCEKTWWSTLLYIQNYVNPGNICVLQSWYLAIDTQLYILSPLILLPLWRWGIRTIPIIVVLALLSVGSVFTIFVLEGYTSLLGFDGKEMTYFPTHARCSVWFVGIILGYFLHINRRNTIRLPKLLQLFGWIVSFGTILSIIFGPYFTISSSYSATVLQAAAYESLKRVSWSIALGWIVFACHFGFGGIVNDFLAHPIWQPLGRLTYCMYLVHMAVQTIVYGTSRTDVYFSDYTLMLTFWSNFGISLLVSIVLSLAFEAPVMVLEKAVFGRSVNKISSTAAQ